MPLCADRVDALTTWRVDFQYIPSESQRTDGCNRYVAYQKQRWNGNDVYWLQDKGLPTTNFQMAAIYQAPGKDDDLIWLPFDIAEAQKRRTVSYDHVDRRNMVQAAGLLTPAHIKRYRNRKASSGKTRWNCPCCGQIGWQHNPYDFEGCKNIDCEEWRPGLALAS